MSQRIVVNGVEYDSPDAMPPDVRRQYETALAALQQLGEGTAKKTVQSVPGGLKINVTTRRVQYNVDGKSYDDLSQLPPEIRAKVERALAQPPNVDIREETPAQVRIIHTDVEQPKRRGTSALLWVLLAALAALVIASL
jgi:phage-related protein